LGRGIARKSPPEDKFELIIHTNNIVAVTKNRKKYKSDFRKLTHVVWHCQYPNTQKPKHP